MADPKDMISQFKQQGLSNPQIVQQLQQQGFKSHEIFDALNQVDMIDAGPQTMPQPSGLAPQPPPPMSQPTQLPPMSPPSSPPLFSPGMPMSNENVTDSKTEKIEEIAEIIIEEKWTELIKNVNKIVDWKQNTDIKITKLERDFDNIRKNFDKLHEGILGKIGEYEHGMTNLGTEIKALESVFQKILPTLTENVHELSRITKNLKKK